MRMAERMNLHHCRDHVAGNQGITHAGSCLYNAVAYVAHGEDAGFAACFEDSVVDLGNERFEVKGSRVSHPPGAFHQDLWFGKIFLGPIHAQSKSVALMVVCSEFLASKLPLVACHGPFSCCARYAVCFRLRCIASPARWLFTCDSFSWEESACCDDVEVKKCEADRALRGKIFHCV